MKSNDEETIIDGNTNNKQSVISMKSTQSMENTLDFKYLKSNIIHNTILMQDANGFFINKQVSYSKNYFLF